MINIRLTFSVLVLSLSTVNSRNCPWGNDPVCGVDYVTYPNQCALAAAYVEMLHMGECTKVLDGKG
jgi:hypothetical protein